MRCAIRVVERVSLVVAVHDAVHPHRSEHAQFGLCGVGDPALKRDAAEPADVVGVEVREQHGLDLVWTELHPVEGFRGLLAGVDHVDLLVNNHSRAWVSPLLVRNRRTRTADCDVQAVRERRYWVG